MARKTIKEYLDQIYHYTSHLPEANRFLERIGEHVGRLEQPKRIGEMIGEAFREVGILVFVFCVIEGYLGIAKTSDQFRNITLISFGVSCFFLAIGLGLERWRARPSGMTFWRWVLRRGE